MGEPLGERSISSRTHLIGEGPKGRRSARRLIDRSADLALLSERDRELTPPASRANEVGRPAEDPRMVQARRIIGVAQRTEEILPKGRNFR